MLKNHGYRLLIQSSEDRGNRPLSQQEARLFSRNSQLGLLVLLSFNTCGTNALSHARASVYERVLLLKINSD